MLDDAIEILDEYGRLSAPMLMSRFKLSYTGAKILLREIVEACENVVMVNENFICIQEPGFVNFDENVLKNLHREKRQMIKNAIKELKEKDLFFNNNKRKINGHRYKDVTKP
jgi:hypothetical protein